MHGDPGAVHARLTSRLDMARSAESGGATRQMRLRATGLDPFRTPPALIVGRHGVGMHGFPSDVSVRRGSACCVVAPALMAAALWRLVPAWEAR